MDFDRWLALIVTILSQLVLGFKPPRTPPTLLPSILAELDPDPSYNNLVIISIIEDDAYFSLELVDWLVEFFEEHPQMDKARFAQLRDVVQMIHEYAEHYKVLNKHLQSVLEDAPDEFMDPLMCTVMQQPVILPSNNRCDLSTVERQLAMNNPRDPFTREPITKEMIRPDEELKKRIHEYLKEKFKERFG